MLPALFSANQKLLRDTLDPLMLLLKATNPLLYAHYVRARIVIDRGGSGANNPEPAATNVNGTITDANTGLPIQEAIMNLSADQGSIQTTTDAEGKYTFPLDDVVAAVPAMLTASHPLYLADSRQITIVPNTDRTEDFGLSPAPPTP